MSLHKMQRVFLYLHLIFISLFVSLPDLRVYSAHTRFTQLVPDRQLTVGVSA